MNYNKKNDHPVRMVILALLCVAVVAVIIFTKNATDEVRPSLQNGSAASLRPMAVPDTSIDPAIVPATSDSAVQAELPDTLLGRDKRSPFEAGNEDGYAAGCDDGAAGQERATYDETSNFTSATDRDRYAAGYREGYAAGFKDGSSGTQFGIRGQ